MARAARVLPTRVARDNLSFRCEEKLDTWLDFGSAFALKEYARYNDGWSNLISDDCLDFITKETIYEFEAHSLSTLDIANSVLTPRIIALIQKMTLTSTITNCHLSQQTVRDTIGLVVQATSISMQEQHFHLSSTLHRTLARAADEGLDQLLDRLNDWPKELMTSFMVMEDWMNVLKKRRHLHEFVAETKPGRRVYKRFRSEEYKCDGDPFVVAVPTLKGKILLGHDYSILDFQGKLFLLTDDLLLGIINKVSELFCCLLYNFIQSGTILPLDHYTCCVNLYIALCNELTSTPMRASTQAELHDENKAFALLKGIEGLGVATIIAYEDIVSGWENTSLITTMWRELYRSQVVRERQFTNHPVGKAILAMSSPQIADVIGTVKLFGHPAIEIRLGAAQLYERTHEDLAIDPEAVRGGLGVLTRDLFKSFTMKHKRFPNVELDDPDLHPRLRQLIETKTSFMNQEGIDRWATINSQQWSTLKFGQNAEFDTVDNQLPLIKDKALGLTRSQVFLMLVQDTGNKDVDGEWDVFREKTNEDWMTNREKYRIQREKIIKTHKGSSRELNELLADLEEDKEETERKKRRKLIRAEERRTLLSFLLAPNFNDNFRKYLNSYENDPDWRQSVLNYLVIKLTAKELEMKAMGRFFGASPAEERNRRVVQDKNTMSIMSAHFPDQLMTPDDLGIMKKLVSFRYFADVYPHHVLFQVSFDFSKWNNSMRAESIDIPAQALLDRWFGRKLFGKTMQAYQHMLVYLRESDYKRWWSGQLGGIEGLNQATWSLIFLGGIKHALENAGVHYQVTVKGDDVRAAIAVPQEQVVRRGGYDAVRDDIMERIQLLCRQMGWQLNPQESFVSLTLIATSKQYQVRRSWLPAASKKIMKMMSLSNILFPTLEDLIGSIFSCAHSACSQATAIYPAYTAATLVASLEFIRAFGLKDMNPDKLVALLMWPQAMGGPGSLPIQTFFVRGENDMLSVSISLYCSILRDSNRETLKKYILSILNTKVSTNPDPILLLSDPYAISLDIPERPASLLKRLIRKKLKNWVKNVDIKRLLTDQSEREKEILVLYLFSMSPYLGKIATAIWENSPFYLIEEVLAKFMESPTVVALFSSGVMTRESSMKAYQALTEIIKAAQRRLNFWRKTMSNTPLPVGKFLGVEHNIWVDRGRCPTEITYLVRNRAWKKEIIGVTYPSLVTQCMIAPTGLMKGLYPRWKTDRLCMQVEVKKDNLTLQTNLISHHYASRPQTKPWVGSQTSPKVTLPGIESKQHSPTLSKLMKLILMTKVTASMGGDIQILLRNCIRALTPIDVEPLLQLAPQGDGGHTTHRLNINAYSMNTMPNYRHNILQLTNINRDTMKHFHNDPRDRTINFAALHFFHAAMSVLPLQVCQFLPDDYPSDLEVMFHPEFYDRDQYIVCSWCNKVVDDDVPITFSGKQPVNLHKFSSYQLIGCSKYDENVIQTSTMEYLETRVNTELVQEMRDPNDPLVRAAAALSIVNQMRLSSTTIHSVAKSFNYQRVPQGEILNACLANLGLTSIYKVSIVLLRCIPPALLYQCLMQITFWTFINDTVSYDLDTAITLELSKAPWNNALSHLFEQIINASLVTSLVDGCEEVGLISGTFVIKPGMQNSGQRLAYEFMRAHLGLYKAVCLAQDVLPQLRVFNQFQGDETIYETIMMMRVTIMRWIAKCINHQSGSFSAVKDLINKIRNRLLEEEIVWDRTEYPTFHAWMSAVHQIYPDLLETIINRLVFQSTANYQFEESRTNIMTHSLLKLMIICFIDQYVQPGDCAHMEAGDLRAEIDYHIFYYVNPTQIEVMDQSGLEDELVGIQLMERHLPLPIVIILYRSCFNALHNVMGWNEQTINLWMNLCIKLDMICSHYNLARISAQSIEESERVLRSYGIQNYREHYEHELAERRELPMNDNRDRRFADEYRFVHRCRLGDRIEHEEVRGLNFVDLIHGDISEQRLTAVFGRMPTRQEYQVYRLLWIDTLEYKRCIGRNNTSLSKYIEIISSLRLDGLGVLDAGMRTLCVCLADGIGGVTAYLTNKHNESFVVYNSLKIDATTDRPVADSAIIQPPLETIDPFFPAGTHRRVTYATSATGDLTKPEVQMAIINEVTNKPIDVGLITMDADIAWDLEPSNYHSLLFGSLYIASMVMNRTTICIFKTFCIKEQTIMKFLSAICTMFRHVHIYRSGCTRQHSTEIFVIFQLPVDLDLTRTQCQILLEQNVNYPYHPELEEYIARRLEPIIEGIRLFRDEGRSIRTRMFEDFTNKILNNGGYLLSLSSIISWYQGIILPFNIHLCEIYLIVAEECRVQIATRHHILTECVENNGYAFLNSTRGDKVTGGWQHLRLEIMRITKMKALEECCRTIENTGHILPEGRIRNIRDAVYRYVALHFQGPIEKQQVRLVSKDNCIWSITMHYEDNLTLIIRSAIHKFMQIVGCITMINLTLVNERHIMRTRELIRSFSPSLQLRPCCYQVANNRDATRELDLGFARGVELSHSNWGNQPDVNFDLILGRYPEQVLRDEIRHVIMAPISIDEDLEEEIISGSAERQEL